MVDEGVLDNPLDAAIVQVHGDHAVYRASALGSCLKALVAARLEYDPVKPGEVWQGRFERGHRLEDRAVEVLHNRGWYVGDRQMEVNLQVTGKVFVRGHIDGRAFHKNVYSGPVLLEIKSQTDAAWEEFQRKGWDGGLFPKYKWQQSVYMHVLGLPLQLVRIRELEDGEVEVSEEDLIHDPFYSREEIFGKVLLAESYGRGGELPEQCTSSDFPCPYVYLHSSILPDPIADDELDVAAREFKQAQVQEKRARSKQQDLRAVLLKEMEKRGLEEALLSTGVKVKVSKTKPSTYTVNKKEGVRLTVTVPDQDEEGGEDGDD